VVDEHGGVARVARTIGLRSHAHLSLALSRDGYRISPEVLKSLWEACGRGFHIRDAAELLCPTGTAELIDAAADVGKPGEDAA